jgi:hypothetical protein
VAVEAQEEDEPIVKWEDVLIQRLQLQVCCVGMTLPLAIDLQVATLPMYLANSLLHVAKMIRAWKQFCRNVPWKVDLFSG